MNNSYSGNKPPKPKQKNLSSWNFGNKLLVRIVGTYPNKVSILIPGWNPHKVLFLSFCHGNLAADRLEDLNLCGFRFAPKPDAKDGLE